MANDHFTHSQALNGDDAGRGCPSILELAALVDGSIDQIAQAEVTRHVANCERCARLSEHVRSEEPSSDAMTFVPKHVLDAAKALVPGNAERAVEGDPRRQTLWPALRWASAAAAAVFISALGYQVGASMQNASDANDQLAMELSFQLIEDSNIEDELQLFPLDDRAVTQGVMQ